MGIAIFFSLLLLGIFPALSFLFIFRFFRSYGESRSFAGLVVIQILACGCSLWGAGYFLSDVGLDFNWLSNGELSGYFRVSAIFNSQVLINVAVSQILFLIYILDSRFRGEWHSRNSIDLSFRYLGTLLVAVSFLSENISISILFFELALFLFYVSKKAEPSDFYQLSDRLIYISIGMLALLAISLVVPMRADSLIFFSLLLYLLAFIFSATGKVREGFTLDVALPILFYLFLLERNVEVNALNDLMMRVAPFWAIGAIVFSVLAIRCGERKDYSAFTFWAILFFILFNRFVVVGGASKDWSIYMPAHLVAGVVFVLQLAKGGLLRGTRMAVVFLSIFYLFTVILLRPGFLQVDALSEGWWVLAFGAMAAFFLALGLIRNLSDGDQKADSATTDLKYSVSLGIVFYFGAVSFLVLELSKQGLINRLLAFLINSPMSYYPIAFFLGLGLGWLLVRTKSKLFLTVRGAPSMDKVFPPILPAAEGVFLVISQAVKRQSGGLLSRGFAVLGAAIERWSEKNSLEALASTGLLSFVRGRSDGLFSVSSYLHGGKVRVYWMWSSLAIFIIFLLSVILP